MSEADHRSGDGRELRLVRSTGPLVESALGNPVPRPRQVFAIGLNYRSHAEPARILEPGQELETWIEGIGTIRNRCR